MMSTYDDQAETFLEATDTTMTVRRVDTAKYFHDDKEEHDIYEITITRHGLAPYTFRFGQSLAKTGSGQEPSKYEVLSCLTKRDPEKFNDFCAEYGYDTDSRQAYRLWQACRKEWRQVRRLFGDVLAQLQDIA